MGSFDDIDKAWGTQEPAPPGGNYPVIPNGTKGIRVAVIDQKADYIGGNETPDVKVTFEVVEPENFEGVRIWHDFWITRANVPYLKRDLLTLGWKGEKISALMDPNNADLIGLGAEVTVNEEEYEKDGQKRKKNTVRFFDAPWKPPAPAEGEAPPEDL